MVQKVQAPVCWVVQFSSRSAAANETGDWGRAGLRQHRQPGEIPLAVGKCWCKSISSSGPLLRTPLVVTQTHSEHCYFRLSPLPSYTSLLKDENYEKYEKDEDVFKFNACLAPAPAAPLPPQNTAQAPHQQLQGRSPETWPGWNLSRSECGWWWCVWRVTVLCVTVWHGAMWSHLHHPNLFITAP